MSFATAVQQHQSTATGLLQERNAAEILRVQKEANDRKKEAQKTVRKEAILKVLKERISENPLYSIGDLWDEVKSARGLRKELNELPLLEVVKALKSLSEKKLLCGPSLQERTMAILSRSPDKDFRLRFLATKTNSEYSRMHSLVKSLENQKLVVRSGDGFRLQTRDARNYILRSLEVAPRNRSYLMLHCEDLDQHLVDLTITMLCGYGTIVQLENNQFSKR